MLMLERFLAKPAPKTFFNENRSQREFPEKSANGQDSI
jgi:hypothetical protein